MVAELAALMEEIALIRLELGCTAAAVMTLTKEEEDCSSSLVAIAVNHTAADCFPLAQQQKK